MGLFGPKKLTADKLPDDVDKLRKKGDKCYDKQDYEGTILCYEKLYEMGAIYPAQLERLAKLYAKGHGCQKDINIARKYFYEAQARHSPFHIIWNTISPSRHENLGRIAEPDYDLLINTLANYIEKNKKSKVEEAAWKFHFLRDLIHLCESGMKTAKSEEELKAFFSDKDEWVYRVYGPACTLTDYNSGFSISTDELISLMREDSIVVIQELSHRFFSLSGLTQKERDARRKVWNEVLPSYNGNKYSATGKLAEKFMEKYGSMTAKEMLDALYNDEAKWQSANSAEIKAAQAAEAARQQAELKRAKEGEDLYRQGLMLFSGIGGNSADGLNAMHQAAELGNPRAKLWLLKREADNGNAEAVCIMGDLAMTGQLGIHKDELAAYEHYLSAVGLGSGRAAANLAQLLLSGVAGMEPDKEQAEKFLMRAAELGHGPSCLSCAESYLNKKDFTTAETLLSRATSSNEPDVVMSATGALANLYLQKGNLNKAFEYAVRFTELDYATEPDDKSWEEHRSGVLSKDANHLYEMYRVYCLYHNSGPAQRHLERITLGYRHRVGLVFSALYCEILRPRAEAGDLEACTLLYIQLSDTGYDEEAFKWGYKAIKGKYPRMLYVAAYLDADRFNLDDAQVFSYLQTASKGSGMYADWCKDLADSMLQEKREAWRKERQIERARQAQIEAAKQAAINESISQLRRSMDMLERDIDLALNGSGHTIDEYAIRGDVSATDRLRHEMAREAIEEKLRSKLNNM